MVVHPMIWTRRRPQCPAASPTSYRHWANGALEGEGLAVIERRESSLLADGSVATAART
jgi:7,8-dihydropterin-6-yl-methyl-4-(beta-D-ribofuranosyl)aminobenzene 5'-phosphate synthase